MEDDLIKKYINIFGNKLLPHQLERIKKNKEALKTLIEAGEEFEERISSHSWEDQDLQQYYKDRKELIHRELVRELPLENSSYKTGEYEVVETPIYPDGYDPFDFDRPVVKPKLEYIKTPLWETAEYLDDDWQWSDIYAFQRDHPWAGAGDVLGCIAIEMEYLNDYCVELLDVNYGCYTTNEGFWSISEIDFGGMGPSSSAPHFDFRDKVLPIYRDLLTPVHVLIMMEAFFEKSLRTIGYCLDNDAGFMPHDSDYRIEKTDGENQINANLNFISRHLSTNFPFLTPTLEDTLEAISKIKQLMLVSDWMLIRDELTSISFKDFFKHMRIVFIEINKIIDNEFYENKKGYPEGYEATPKGFEWKQIKDFLKEKHDVELVIFKVNQATAEGDSIDVTKDKIFIVIEEDSELVHERIAGWQYPGNRGTFPYEIRCKSSTNENFLAAEFEFQGFSYAILDETEIDIYRGSTREVTYSDDEGLIGMRFKSPKKYIKTQSIKQNPKFFLNNENDKPANHGLPWSIEAEEELMEDFGNGIGIDQLANKFQRTIVSITLKIRRIQITTFLKEREIEHLIHFTDKRNLDSIKKHGILSVQDMKQRGISFYNNDLERFDKHLDGISLSITSRNSFLFTRFQQRNKRNWIEIYIKPEEILFKNKCFFYDYNAAASKFKDKSESELSSFSALQGMFADTVKAGGRNHTRLDIVRPLPKNQPTSVQAEIIVKGAITRSEIIKFVEINV